jgi:hypothetical protein
MEDEAEDSIEFSELSDSDLKYQRKIRSCLDTIPLLLLVERKQVLKMWNSIHLIATQELSEALRNKWWEISRSSSRSIFISLPNRYDDSMMKSSSPLGDARSIFAVFTAKVALCMFMSDYQNKG